MKNTTLSYLKTLIFISLFFAIGSAVAQPLSNRQVVEKIIGKVDNHVVLKSEMEVMYLQYMANNQFKFSNENIRCSVLESLLINKLLLAKADIDSVTVDDKMVDDQLERRMAYFVQQIGSEEKLEEYYNKSIAELKKDLRRQVKEQMVGQKMQDKISGNIKLTPGEVKKFYAQIPNDSLPYFSKEAEVGEIVIEASIGKEQKKEAQETLQKLKARIVAGESFADLAKLYSQDPGSGANGGELGFFKKGELVPEYEAASLKLKPGELSEIVESQFGFHLIQMIERRGSEFNTRHILIKPASSTLDIQATTATLERIRTQILMDSISFSKAAKDFSQDKVTAESGGLMVDPKSGATMMPVENLDPSVFFVIDTMKVGDITHPIPYRTPEGKEAMRVIYLKKIMAPHKANFNDDYQKILAAAIAERKNKVLAEWFAKTKSEVFIDVDDEYKTCDILK
jgi:peptidyl-prolyl cis-trans isomerase SurA